MTWKAPAPPPWSVQLLPQIHRPGHLVGAEVALLDLHRLLALVLSADRVEALRVHPEDPNDPIELMMAAIEPELTRLLLSTAVLIRAHHDSLVLQDGSATHTPAPALQQCGTLAWELGGTQDLTLREACNKIIHAESARMDSPTGRVLYVEGRQQAQRWRGAIDMVEYARLGVLIVS